MPETTDISPTPNYAQAVNIPHYGWMEVLPMGFAENFGSGKLRNCPT